MLLKLNFTFVTSVTLNINVTTPKHTGFLRDIWGSYIPSFSLVAVIYCTETGVFRQTDGQGDSTTT